MAVYRIADVLTELEPEFELLKRVAEPYRCKNGEQAEFRTVLKKGYAESKHKEHPELSVENWEYFYTGCLFSSLYIEKGGFVIHASSIGYDGKAYLFSADSGTGKSTHVGNWMKYFGEDKVKIINDDKPAVKKKDGTFRVFGTPFSGKNNLNNDVSYPIKALCFIHRSKDNEIRRLTPEEAIPYLFRQTLRPSNKERTEKLLLLLDEFLKEVPVYSLGCNMDIDSARAAYEGMNREE